MESRVKIVVFDMDGVLVDSEPLHASSMRRILLEHGIDEMPDSSVTVGKSALIVWNDMIDRYGIPGTAEEVLEKQYRYLLEEMAMKKTKPTVGLLELLAYLKERGIQRGIASSSGRYLVDGTLDYLGIRDWFSYITAGNEVPEKKPDPALYLSVLEKSGFSAEQALAVEDSSTGLVAAYRAGIPAVGYQNPTSGDQDLSQSIGIIDAIIGLKNYL